MTTGIRVALAALIVFAVAAASALFIGYRTGIVAARSDAFDVATTGDLDDLFAGNRANDTRLVDLALQKLETAFYKPVDPNAPVRGEAGALEGYLRTKKVAAALPNERARDIDRTETQQVADLLSYAQDHFASQLGANGNAELTDAALRGIMSSVKDPYTVYLSPREAQGLDEELSGGNFGGIGVYIYQLRDGRIILQPIEQMPAARAGMKPGEIVDSVGGKPVRGLPLDRVEQMIRGEVGTVVRLTTHPYSGKGGERSFAIVREIIHVPTVRAKMENGFDYIRLSDFGVTSGDELRAALVNGQAKGAKGYILDLRDNGGGLLDVAVQISSLFIPQGTIVSTIRRDGESTSEEARGDAIVGLKPLVVLVNKYTASASEITAGALQDYHLATLIGTRTFGKGVVQSIFPLPDHGDLKITTARYVTPSGRDIQHHGIVPDIVIDQDPDPALIDTPADKQLAIAKAHLHQNEQ
ncbi:MAG: S41 family peptidase [Candidatus Eremiobacteraeota bacterium]|nr:S41 family peptidase [Candidatus Eremiobacteraeota bacterium]